MSTPYDGSGYAGAGTEKSSAPVQSPHSAAGGPSSPGGSHGSSGGSSAKNGVGLWAMILGLGGLIFGALTGIPGAIMGAVGLKNVNNGEADNKGQAMTGLIAGSVTSLGSLVGGVIVIIMIFTGGLFASAGGAGSAGGGGSDPAPAPNDPTQASQGSGGENTGSNNNGRNVEVKRVEIADGVEVSMASTQVTASDTAIPVEAQNNEYMFVEVTFTNSSTKKYDFNNPSVSAQVNGSPAQKVTDINTQPNPPSSLPGSIAPGERASLQTGFLIAGADVSNVVVTVSHEGKKVAFEKQ